mgnify:CR=1 FL=1
MSNIESFAKAVAGEAAYPVSIEEMRANVRAFAAVSRSALSTEAFKAQARESVAGRADFDEAALDEALDSFQSRERRFGKTSEQIASAHRDPMPG